jgi:hypothetical protein
MDNVEKEVQFSLFPLRILPNVINAYTIYKQRKVRQYFSSYTS